MCLLVVAWQNHPRYRLVVAGNRDEFHERPTAPLGWWSDEPGVLAGRDLQAGGTWLGLSRSGRFGLVTNFRDADAAARTDAPSRGALVPAFLRDASGAVSYLDELQARATQYSGFNLLLGDATGLHYYTNVGGAAPRVLAPGIYGLSNHRLDEPWPKLVRTRERFAAALQDPDPAPATLLDLLGDATPAALDIAPDAGLPADLERALSAPFVRHERYGTRCSTVVLVAHDGRTTVHERRFEPTGAQSGASRLEFAGHAG
jgi:uncharacterized protein with NRDE domain